MNKSLVIGGLISLLSLAPEIGSAQSGTCKSTDAFSNHVIASLRLLMSPTNSAERTAIGLPQVNTAEVALISDANICTQARLAMDSLAHAWNPNVASPPLDSRALYVVQVGNTYCVFNPYVASNNNYEFLYYFASNWQFVSMRVL